MKHSFNDCLVYTIRNIEFNGIIKDMKTNMYNGKKMAIKTLPPIMLCLSFIFVFYNSDIYLGIADYFVFLALYVVFSVCANRHLLIRKDEKYLLLFIGYIPISLLIALCQGVFSTGYLFSYLLYLAVMLLMVCQDHTDAEIKGLINSYIFSAVLIAVMMLLQRYDFYSGNQRHTLKVLNHEAIDPNFLAAYLVAPAVIAFSKMIKHFCALNAVSFLLIIAGVLYTSSRGATLSILLGIGIVMLGLLKGKVKKKEIITVLMILALGVVLAVVFIPKNSLIRIVDFKSYYDRSNAKRMVDWEYGIRAFLKRPLLGYGLQGELSIIKRAIGVNYISHNTFIAFLLQFGIIGFLIIAICFAKLYKRIWRKWTLKGALTATLAASFFISGETSLVFWIPVMLITTVAAAEQKSLTMNEWL